MMVAIENGQLKESSFGKGRDVKFAADNRLDRIPNNREWCFKSLEDDTAFIQQLVLTFSVMIQGSLGRQLSTASENLVWGQSCSKRMTSFSASLSPTGPMILTK